MNGFQPAVQRQGQPDGYTGADQTAAGALNSDPIRTLIEALASNPELAAAIAPTMQGQRRAETMQMVPQELQRQQQTGQVNPQIENLMRWFGSQ